MKKGMRTFLALVSIVFLCGCFPASTHAPSPTSRYYTVDYPAPGPLKKWEGEATMKIESITAVPPFSATYMVKQKTPFSREVTRREQWQAPPATMMENLLLRDLSLALPSLIVLPKESAENARFVLEGKITEFLAVEKDGEPLSRVVIIITILDTGEKEENKRVAVRKYYMSEEKIRDLTPLEISRGMSAAISHLIQEIAMDIEKELQKRLKGR